MQITRLSSLIPGLFLREPGNEAGRFGGFDGGISLGYGAFSCDVITLKNAKKLKNSRHVGVQFFYGNGEIHFNVSNWTKYAS